MKAIVWVVAAASLAMLAKVLGAPTLQAAAHHLVASLAHDFQLDGASLGGVGSNVVHPRSSTSASTQECASPCLTA